jgi:putative DNA primase/helicase
MPHDDGAEPVNKLNGAAVESIAPSLDDAAIDVEIDRLSKLSVIAFERERLDTARKLGLRPVILDKLVKAKQTESAPDRGQGRAIELPEPELWDKPVDGAGLITEITAEIRRYMVMADGAAESVALWVLHTHALDAFGISPRLAITSPRPGCGKTTLLDILQHLTPRPLLTANISGPSIFRTVEVARPVLLADEADSWLTGKNADDSLRGILNSGHRRGGSVIRIVGDDLEPRQFSTWGACAIAMIGKLPTTLADRSVPVQLQRKRPDEVVEQFRFDRTEKLDVLARKVARWGKDTVARLCMMDPLMPARLSNRAADNWRPLLTIADAVGGDWPKRAREIAAATVDADQSKRASLLADIRDVFEEKRSDKISSVDLVDALVALEGHDWAEYRQGRPITTNGLARLLARDNISPGTVWFGEGHSLKGYKLSQFDDAFARYLPDPPNQTVRPSPPAENQGLPGILNPSGVIQPDGSEMAGKPQKSAAPNALTDENSPQGREVGQWSL